MSSERRRLNPFYALVVLSGAAFGLTACAYGVLTYRAIRGVDVGAEPSRAWQFLNEHGGLLLGIELAVLAVATILAIGTENFWQRRQP
ncbi:MAG: hypothetical protein JSS27_20775 [Planctomycetes bacterium]|nr:hypothetical protein [Planctomycetota bacterium]